MIRRLIQKGLTTIESGNSQRFLKEWDTRSTIGALVRMGVCALRGLRVRFRVREARGFLFIGKGVRLRQPAYLTAGKNLIIEDGAEINCLSKRGIVFGNRVSVGSFALIRPTNINGGDVGEGLTVGDNSNIGPFSYIGCSGIIRIGNNVMISPRVSIYSENHNFQRTDVPMKEQGVTKDFVIIEDDCWIAANSVILAGVTVGQGSIVAAGSIVTKDVPAYSIVAGNPARVIRSRVL